MTDVSIVAMILLFLLCCLVFAVCAVVEQRKIAQDERDKREELEIILEEVCISNKLEYPP
jgi:hypothetical protein